MTTRGHSAMVAQTGGYGQGPLLSVRCNQECRGRVLRLAHCRRERDGFGIPSRERPGTDGTMAKIL